MVPSKTIILFYVHPLSYKYIGKSNLEYVKNKFEVASVFCLPSSVSISKEFKDTVLIADHHILINPYFSSLLSSLPISKVPEDWKRKAYQLPHRLSVATDTS